MDNEHMLLELDHISKIYGDLHAVDDLSLTVPQGQWLAIVGSSGSGKTTLMNMIGCMDTPSKGSVMLEGRRLEDLNARQLADVRKNMIGDRAGLGPQDRQAHPQCHRLAGPPHRRSVRGAEGRWP